MKHRSRKLEGKAHPGLHEMSREAAADAGQCLSSRGRPSDGRVEGSPEGSDRPNCQHSPVGGDPSTAAPSRRSRSVTSARDDSQIRVAHEDLRSVQKSYSGVPCGLPHAHPDEPVGGTSNALTSFGSIRLQLQNDRAGFGSGNSVQSPRVRVFHRRRRTRPQRRALAGPAAGARGR